MFTRAHNQNSNSVTTYLKVELASPLIGDLALLLKGSLSPAICTQYPTDRPRA